MTNNSSKLWFRAKLYGWGWYPATWQGWLVTLIYVMYITYRANAMSLMFDTWQSATFRYIFELIPPTLILLLICYLKGQPPRWRWGK